MQLVFINGTREDYRVRAEQLLPTGISGPGNPVPAGNCSAKMGRGSQKRQANLFRDAPHARPNRRRLEINFIIKVLTYREG